MLDQVRSVWALHSAMRVCRAGYVIRSEALIPQMRRVCWQMFASAMSMHRCLDFHRVA
jgi:hypothetical protein